MTTLYSLTLQIIIIIVAVVSEDVNYERDV